MTDPDIVDIVTLLRSPDRFEPHTCNAAADEIERLYSELHIYTVMMGKASQEIERLRVERDEAKSRLVRALSLIQEYEAREQ